MLEHKPGGVGRCTEKGGMAEGKIGGEAQKNVKAQGKDGPDNVSSPAVDCKNQFFAVESFPG
ncbi:MAG: hypothetical protein ACLFSF_07370 [Desulfonatronovibrio sp.]